MTEIAKKHTACKNCIFAKYKNNTQIGCTLHKLENYEQKNIVEVFDIEKEFYVINNILCLYYRDYNWSANTNIDLENIGQDEISYKHIYEELLKIIHKEISIKYQAIIILNNDISDLQITIDSLLKQNPLPTHISVIRPYGHNVRPKHIVYVLKQAVGTFPCNIPWRSENMVNPSLTIENHIDIILDAVHDNYYTVFQAGFNVPINTFSQINDLFINRQLKYATILPNSTNNGLIVPFFIHQIIQGNKDKSFINKIKTEPKWKNHLIQICQIVQNFPE